MTRSYIVLLTTGDPANPREWHVNLLDQRDAILSASGASVEEVMATAKDRIERIERENREQYDRIMAELYEKRDRARAEYEKHMRGAA